MKKAISFRNRYYNGGSESTHESQLEVMADGGVRIISPNLNYHDLIALRNKEPFCVHPIIMGGGSGSIPDERPIYKDTKGFWESDSLNPITRGTVAKMNSVLPVFDDVELTIECDGNYIYYCPHSNIVDARALSFISMVGSSANKVSLEGSLGWGRRDEVVPDEIVVAAYGLLIDQANALVDFNV